MGKRINWTHSQEQYILANYPQKSHRQIGIELGIEEHRVRCKYHYLVNGGAENNSIHKYSISDLKYLVQNYHKKKIVELARHIGVPGDNLRKKIMVLRNNTKRGRELFPPKYKGDAPEGTVVTRKDGKYIKRDGVWVRYSLNPNNRSEPKPKKAKELKKVPSPAKTPSRKATYGKPERPAPKLKLDAPDLSTKIAVKVDSKTTVYVTPGTDIAALKEKYKRKIA